MHSGSIFWGLITVTLTPLFAIFIAISSTKGALSGRVLDGYPTVMMRRFKKIFLYSE
jgi:hypothetical protein